MLPAPRGSRRILYNSDPSTIASQLLPDLVRAEDLRRWVDMLGDAGVDTFIQESWNQGFTVYWRSEQLQYDQRPQHRRFLAMLDSGTQPLQVMLDRCRERGMSFLAGFRMNDTHDFPVYAEFIQHHPEWELAKRWDVLGIERPPEAAINQGGKPLDYTHEPVRAFIHEAMARLVTDFDVDGIEMILRDPGYFPVPQARDRLHLMTDLVRRVRATLDNRGRSRGKRLLLGARVFSTLDECLDLGLDVPTWIADGLIDYCAPMDTMFSDFNAEYATFCGLARDSDCMIYPGLHPWTSHRMRKSGEAMTLPMCRALAHTFYAGGADGVSVFNDFVGHLWTPPFYPQSLHRFHQLRDPERVIRGDRHYVFDPTWGGVPWQGNDVSTSGAVKAQRVVLDRGAEQPSGTFRFLLYEHMDRVHLATLLLRGHGMTEQDELEVSLNGKPLAEGPFGSSDWRTRERYAVAVIAANDPPGLAARTGPLGFQAPRSVMDTRWFPLQTDAPAWGENRLSVTLTSADSKASGDLVLDEVEVWVQPR
jgi:hypothetical protein